MDYFDNLYLEFNDNVPEEGDEVTGMGYIREPSGILYDLISLIQANQQLISISRQDIYVMTDNIGRMIIIFEKQQGDKDSNIVLDMEDLKHFDSKILLSNI